MKPKTLILSSIVISALILISFFSGMGIGASQSLDWCVGIGLHFLKANNINITIDEQSIRAGIESYRNQINYCFSDPVNLTK